MVALLLPLLLLGLPAAAAAVAVAATPSAWTNSTTLTVYRVTPIDKEGLANMDSADAAGDVYFGLSQLLLPFACANNQGNSLWCANRKWLSGGNAWMVYRSFQVDVRLPIGEYARCNPDPQTGEFQCSSSGGGGGSALPPSCGSDYDMHHSRYLNGTVYATLPLPANGSLSGCCAKCSSDGKQCAGWQFGTMGEKHPATCSFISATDGKLLNQPSSGSQIASVAKTPGGGSMPLRPRCWYDENEAWDGRLLNETFAPYCDRSQCQCDAMDKLSVGLEPHAMCYDRQRAQAQAAAQATAAGALQRPPSSGSYWACQGQLAKHCDTFFHQVPRDQCLACAERHKSELFANGCTTALIAKACSEPRGCSAAVHQSCGSSAAATACHMEHNQTACKECEQCAFGKGAMHTQQPQLAHWSDSAV
jgi:hypothetical protein